ncbi:UDP-GlcNAc--UDP-phosphate GlcNAc-1-phosphate transferase [Mucilaginibacter sp. AK015]|uniref:UDP-GlcNAc--UDP-phosphate GlcNAc-1-phosphate transferase n=1 Tax=Mucilaginibacter sp. AK015 TaxID=2723072 RepID=UPI001614562D|nr:UDP-GlcNAc--UDP-phosphate GlcNAc-1-phosphate transferase [Mucilaginibacter sp. AK015]MBB5396041.1 UDP-N-acetylmuramyl pentapeptide phosphotransferase/UDP-N-acetylglucosamine-1-phosphate transferase [Mucilaginibacter sp. AK015]
MLYIILFPLFFGAMLLYFRIADHYNIIDHPNERSSHSIITIRGGGIIFLIAALVLMGWHFNEFYIPMLGTLVIGVISFLDDIHTLSSRIRIIIQLIAVSLMFWYLNLYHLNAVAVIAAYIIVIGIINAYNFMDGINGITGLYSLVVLSGLQYINIRAVHFIDADMIWLPIIACLVFLFFNFRKRAKCFAGDVGSVTIAFWITLLLFKIMLFTGNWTYILFLSIYGVDTVLTIIYRLILKQNIFKAHRLHLYQLLANECKVPHLLVSTVYAFVQLIVILIVIQNSTYSPILLSLLIILPLILIYIITRLGLTKGNI